MLDRLQLLRMSKEGKGSLFVTWLYTGLLALAASRVSYGLGHGIGGAIVIFIILSSIYYLLIFVVFAKN